MDQILALKRRFLLLAVLRAWFSSRRARFSDSSRPSFSALCSRYLECLTSFSFRLCTSEESSGSSVSLSQALCSSAHGGWRRKGPWRLEEASLVAAGGGNAHGC
ncbi:hypothetical protein Bca4012_063387 [Brassica carinata]